MTPHNVIDFSKPEPGEAGEPVTLKISGNRLVGLLNTIDSLMFETKRYRFRSDEIVFEHDTARELRDLTESIRDELSAQRNGTTADDVRASAAHIRAVINENAEYERRKSFAFGDQE